MGRGADNPRAVVEWAGERLEEIERLKAENQRLRTALIEAQSWIPGGRREAPIHARIREALEGTP